jgi:hypothetical protein
VSGRARRCARAAQRGARARREHLSQTTPQAHWPPPQPQIRHSPQPQLAQTHPYISACSKFTVWGCSGWRSRSEPARASDATTAALLLSSARTWTRRGNVVYPSSEFDYGAGAVLKCLPQDCQYGCNLFNVRAGVSCYAKLSAGAGLPHRRSCTSSASQ